MKKFLLMLGAVALMTACSDDGGGSGNVSINYEEGYKYLSSLNVSDAKMIYQKTSGTSMKSRAAGDEDGTYYKLDLNGEESKLVIKAEDGQDYNIRIDKIIKLNDEILMVNPNLSDIIDLIYKPDPNSEDEPAMIVHANGYLCLVNIKTEKIYKWPKEVIVNLSDEGAFESTSDNQGNIYFAGREYLNSTGYNQIYKLNPNDFTIQKMLPNNVTWNGFTVTGNGFIVYWNNSGGEWFVKCPAGNIVPIYGNSTFVLDGDLYSVKGTEIVKYETIGDNAVEEEVICEVPDDGDFYVDGRFVQNHVRKSILLNSYYEFDGTKCTKLENPVSIGDLSTSKAWYTFGSSSYTKISMTDYQESQIQITEYYMQDISASPESPNITFTGFRYSDGANVVGTIDENDKITIDNVSDNGEKIINLIPLN